MLDIANEKVLKQYLFDKGILREGQQYACHYCGGGVSCTVAFVQAGDRPIIVKQALAKLKVKEDWRCDPNRMNIEMMSNDIYHRIVPENAPAVLFYDPDNYVFGREAAPDGCSMWKEDLLGGLLDFVVAEKVIDSLLAVHDECSRDAEAARNFADKAIFYGLRISPYIEFTVTRHPALAAHGKAVADNLMNSSITLVHGDFSPKNIMADGRRIYILDYEVAHYGHPCFDLAFFSNHFILKAVKNKQWAESYLNMLRHMMLRYFGATAYMDADRLMRDYVDLLSLLMLARVDGKSPAEYITSDADKQLIRDMALTMLERKTATLDDALGIIGPAVIQARKENNVQINHQ